MDKTQKDEFIQLINQGFQEVMIPAMESMEEEIRKDFKKEIKSLRDEMNQRFNQVDQRFNQVDKKLDRLESRDDRLADEQVDIRTRLRRVENAVFKKVD